MLASLRTTVLPEFSVEVYPTIDQDPRAHQRYVLALRDGTTGSVELVFASARDLSAFLALSREAFAVARQEVSGRRKRLQQARERARALQTTLF